MGTTSFYQPLHPSPTSPTQTLPMNEEGQRTIQPIMHSGNGSGYISSKFGLVLEYHRSFHIQIRPHCPEENRVIERANRTLREKLEELEVASRSEAEEALSAIVTHYRTVSSLSYKPPVTFYRGNWEELDASRVLKLQQASHKGKEKT